MKVLVSVLATAIVIFAVVGAFSNFALGSHVSTVSASGHGGGAPSGGGDPSPGDVVVSDSVTVETSEAFGETTQTSAPSGQTTQTSEAFGQTTGTSNPVSDAAAAYLADVDLNVDQNYDAVAQALGDLDTYQDVSAPLSLLALQNDLVNTGILAVQALANVQAKDITADAVQNVYLLPSAQEYQQLPAAQAQKTLALIMEAPETVAAIEANFTIQLEDANYLGLLNAIADKGALVEEATANALASILDPATLAETPLTDEGLQNLVASISDDLSDAFLDAAQIITADFGIADFADFSVEATFFDTLDYSDVPPIQVNQQALQLYG